MLVLELTHMKYTLGNAAGDIGNIIASLDTAGEKVRYLERYIF